MNQNLFLSQQFENAIQASLQNLGVELSDSKKIADSVLKVSDFYIQNPDGQTPWKEKWCQIAQLAYFLPLNFLRAQRIFRQGEQVGFFKSFDTLIDFGSGLGAGSLAFENLAQNHSFIEISPAAIGIHQTLIKNLWQREIPKTRWNTHVHQVPENTLGVFSYSVTELNTLPIWSENCESLMILEPATSQDGRKLLEQREKLIKKGFFAWAPCTHQEKCPLLHESKGDWCHDRIHWEMPQWFQNIEKHLPIKNSTLTVSYLLMSKRRPTSDLSTSARLTGDLLVEKGKSRQLVCRGPKREFFAWLHRHGEPLETPRGTLIDWPKEFEERPSEIRLTKNLSPAE